MNTCMKHVLFQRLLLMSVLLFQPTPPTVEAASLSTAQAIIDVAKDIVRNAVALGVDEAGSRILGSAWPYFKPAFYALIKPLKQRFPKLFLVDQTKEDSNRLANEAAQAIQDDPRLQKVLLEAFSELSVGQDKILVKLEVINERLERVDNRTAEILELLKQWLRSTAVVPEIRVAASATETGSGSTLTLRNIGGDLFNLELRHWEYLFVGAGFCDNPDRGLHNYRFPIGGGYSAVFKQDWNDRKNLYVVASVAFWTHHMKQWLDGVSTSVAARGLCSGEAMMAVLVQLKYEDARGAMHTRIYHFTQTFETSSFLAKRPMFVAKSPESKLISPQDLEDYWLGRSVGCCQNVRISLGEVNPREVRQASESIAAYANTTR